MNSLDSQITALYTLAHELLYLGSDGSPIYSDHFSRLNGDVLSRANTLYPHHGSTDEEEARLCLSLLMGYNATIYNNGDKEVRIQQIVNRCWEVLDRLPAALLNVRLLTYCYGEVYAEELAKEAHVIIDSWGTFRLTAEQKEAMEELKNIEENPYPWEIIDEE